LALHKVLTAKYSTKHLIKFSLEDDGVIEAGDGLDRYIPL
jgi:hypothetical protein